MRFLTLLCCFFAASTVMAGDFTIATVDMQALFKAYPGTPPAQKKFDILANSKKKELADSQKVLKDLQEELSGSKGVLSDEARKEKQDEFQQQSQDYEDQQNHVQSELADEEQEMTQTLVSQIKVIAAKVAQSEGVNLVLDSNDTVNVRSGMDLTADVLKSFSTLKLNAKTSDADTP